MPGTLTDLLGRTSALALSFLEGLPSRHVGFVDTPAALRTRLDEPMPDVGSPEVEVIDRLAHDLDGGLVASAGPRYFGFVNGGALPAALAADWLAAAWDQNAGLFASSPAAAIVEEVAGRWLIELLGLPATSSVGFVTGCQMANVTCLAAARHQVLHQAGWNAEDDGLGDAPPITVVIGEEAHMTVPRALSLLGLGRRRVIRVPADAQGRMRADRLEGTLETVGGPLIVCAQMGNVNSGAIDPVGTIADLTHRHAGWLHVDGAFGLWAMASPALRPVAAGAERADSWATDGHKWLNVPYDSGLAIIAHSDAHLAAFSASASYLLFDASERDPLALVPEASRRARGLAIYAALRQLGRRGVAELVDRCCALARLMASRLSAAQGVDIVNDVVLNQVLVRFQSDGPWDADALTSAVITQVQRDGICWLGGSSWQGRQVMRVSVSNWSTSTDDIERSADAILAAWRRVRLEPPPAPTR